jgi:hypothetical protein
MSVLFSRALFKHGDHGIAVTILSLISKEPEIPLSGNHMIKRNSNKRVHLIQYSSNVLHLIKTRRF